MPPDFSQREPPPNLRLVAITGGLVLLGLLVLFIYVGVSAVGH